MLGLHVHDGALAVELGHERIGDLRGQLLLQLQTTGKDLDRAGELGKSRDATVGNVADLAVELGHERIGDLRGQLLLQLQTTGKDLDRAGELGKSRDATVGNVADGCLAVEREHMVLAQRVEGDVALDDEVVAGDGEGLGQMLGSASVPAVAKLGLHARNAVGRLDKPHARGVPQHPTANRCNEQPHPYIKCVADTSASRHRRTAAAGAEPAANAASVAGMSIRR